MDKKELISSFIIRNSIIYHNNKLKFAYDLDGAARIVNIGKLVKDIANSEGEIFSIKENNYGRKVTICNNKSISEEIKPYLKNNVKHINKGINTNILISNKVYEIQSSFSIHKFNPYVDLFIRNLEKLLNKTDFYSSKFEAINEFVSDIRNEVSSNEFKKALADYKRLQNKNSLSIKKYSDALFDKYSVLCVIRMNFIYNIDCDEMSMLTDSQIKDEYSQAKKDRKHLFRNMRSNKIFENMVGFIWKLEFCLQKGFHYQMIFYFDGFKEKVGDSKARAIGDYWNNTITKGRGLYFIQGECPVNKKDFGVAMIQHDNTALREELRKAEDYLIKTDYYARMIVPDKDRTFGKGILNKNY